MPHTASKLTGMIYGDHLKDARVHCVVLKVRAVPSPAASSAGRQEKVLRFVSHDPLGVAASGPSGPNSVHVPVDHPEPFQLQAAYLVQDDPNGTLSIVPPMS